MVKKTRIKEKAHIKLSIKEKETQHIQTITIDITLDKLGLWKEDLQKILKEQEGELEEMMIVLRKELFTEEGDYLILEQREFIDV